ncbi:MAG: energy transducer TonB [Alphaproteobacteria bacterium]|jgi:hypothetical protein|nr:energy transducer TonB [Alphaproteobacteria bacterium]MBT4964618.1 energy transducer TonB [Alphaproteobacteria bacterium]MBT5159303.1 energy transducer TonB [Alphaproteobacteria bacterium]MBT5919601.1 energy transducer TonB [Alphaproteobacteria bacterium]MBT6386596.1 energy transducer TonB [Alphaproteobacteria bacterium]
MRTAIVISSTLHVAAVVLAYVGLPMLSRDEELVDLNIIVEMVTVDDVTRAARAKPPEVKAKPKPTKTAEKPKPKPAPPPPAQTQVAAIQPDLPAPPPPPEVAPEPLKAEPLPEPVVVPKPKPKVEPVEKAKVPPKPRWKPKPPPKPVVKKAPPKPKAKPKPVDVAKAKPKKKTKQFDLKRIAALLDKAKKEDIPEVKQAPKKTFDQVKPPELEQPKVVSATAERQDFGQPLTISEVDAVKAKIETCWSMPGGAKGAENFVVRIQFALNPDGSFRGAPKIIDQGSHAGNEVFYRTASEAALRAVQKCEPYDMLPRAKYKRWQDMEMTFDPKEMMGG